ncbi:MAG TPA: V-type ATP synthase subunit I [Methanosarcinales archaeon]|nr:V-type ATP synthase subunit I [Methanosarcinales archaeon]
MLKAKKVSKAVIIGNKKLLHPTVDILHSIQCIHVEDFTEDDSFLRIGKPGEAASKASHKLVKLRSITNFLGIKPTHSDNLQNEDAILNELDAKLEQLDSTVNDLLDRKNVLGNELKNIDDSIFLLEPLSLLPLDLEFYKGYSAITVITGYVQGEISEIEQEIRSITANYELLSSPHDRRNVITLFVPVEHQQQVTDILEKYYFNDIHVPELKGNPGKIMSGMKNRKEDIQLELTSLEDEIADLKGKYMDFILASDEVLSITTEKAEAPLRFATSESTFIIDCWIADDKFHQVEETLETNFNGSVMISKLDAEKEEIESSTIPVEYDNPGLVKPLETIMDLYSRPLYKEIDPSVIIFFTFPLFYGLMLGDIGYGLVLFTLGMVGRAKIKTGGLRPLATLLVYCSITTTIFGVLFAEIFGFHVFGHHSIVAVLFGEHSALGGIFYNFHALPILDRLGKDDIPILLIVSALIGVVHLNLGFILGFRNEAVSHGIKTAVLEKLSWIVLQLGIAIFALAALGYIPVVGMTGGIVISVIGVVMLIAGEGGAAILELPSILSNTLSYTRLAAVGLSSVGIAYAINYIVTNLLFPEGGIFIILGIIVLLIGHTVNTVLGVVAPGLHALRLQYVEFFTKFYHGGGRKFNPFGYNRKYTEVK